MKKILGAFGLGAFSSIGCLWTFVSLSGEDRSLVVLPKDGSNTGRFYNLRFEMPKYSEMPARSDVLLVKDFKNVEWTQIDVVPEDVMKIARSERVEIHRLYHWSVRPLWATIQSN